MYRFRIRQQEDGVYKFERGGIVILADDYTLEGGKHVLAKPGKAIAYFNIHNNIYGVCNDPHHYRTVEEFYDALREQYLLFTDDGPALSA